MSSSSFQRIHSLRSSGSLNSLVDEDKPSGINSKIKSFFHDISEGLLFSNSANVEDKSISKRIQKNQQADVSIGNIKRWCKQSSYGNHVCDKINDDLFQITDTDYEIRLNDRTRAIIQPYLREKGFKLSDIKMRDGQWMVLQYGSEN